jgi:hypothetical protein
MQVSQASCRLWRVFASGSAGTGQQTFGCGHGVIISPALVDLSRDVLVRSEVTYYVPSCVLSVMRAVRIGT